MKSYDNCLYVSVHQNKFNDSRIHGAQTFYSPNNIESKNLANFIQNSISYQLQRDNKRNIKIAGTGIFLLYNATKPTVMVECGFMSNPTEAALLNDEEYQIKMSLVILNGLNKYFIAKGDL